MDTWPFINWNDVKENWPFIVWIGVLSAASSLLVIGIVCRTIALHPDAAGFLS